LSHNPTTLSPCLVRVLITGATGFIGERLVTALQSAGRDIAIFVPPGEEVPSSEGVHPVYGDITDATGLHKTLQSVAPQVVFHLAAVGTSNPNLPLQEAYRVNVGGAINLLEAVRATSSVQRVVMVGTSYEYGARGTDDGLDPFNAYSASKVAAWAFTRAAYTNWGVPATHVRPFQVYGPGQRDEALIPAAIAAALRHDDFPMTRGEQQRDFVFVDDVVAGLIAAAQAPRVEGRVLDLGSGKLHCVREVVECIWAKTASRGTVLAGALPYRPGEVSAIPANVQRTRLLTGWEAEVSLDQGLDRTIATVRAAGGCKESTADHIDEAKSGGQECQLIFR
jgi:UDP-glucose 4-epimerase